MGAMACPSSCRTKTGRAPCWPSPTVCCCGGRWSCRRGRGRSARQAGLQERDGRGDAGHWATPTPAPPHHSNLNPSGPPHPAGSGPSAGRQLRGPPCVPRRGGRVLRQCCRKRVGRHGPPAQAGHGHRREGGGAGGVGGRGGVCGGDAVCAGWWRVWRAVGRVGYEVVMCGGGLCYGGNIFGSENIIGVIQPPDLTPGLLPQAGHQVLPDTTSIIISLKNYCFKFFGN